ncbi:MAG: hypothetical protein JWR61_5659 [Ferruginibacter sp.]|nr:hypothetical protein [Ferruginibacter sp.]
MNATHTGINSLNKHSKNKRNYTECQIVQQYLLKHTATAAMVSAATEIPHKNITRHKRSLEKCGLLWQIKRNTCKQTKFPAWYLSTNPNHPSLVIKKRQ